MQLYGLMAGEWDQTEFSPTFFIMALVMRISCSMLCLVTHVVLAHQLDHSPFRKSCNRAQAGGRGYALMIVSRNCRAAWAGEQRHCPRRSLQAGNIVC
jgi:hypothetical protein